MDFGSIQQRANVRSGSSVGHAPDKGGAVSMHIENMDTAIQRAFERLDAITRKLEPLLRSSGPDGASGSTEPMPQSSLAEKIRGQVVGVAALANRIDDLLERIDL
jgi:hypothetical protein